MPWPNGVPKCEEITPNTHYSEEDWGDVITRVITYNAAQQYFMQDLNVLTVGLGKVNRKIIVMLDKDEGQARYPTRYLNCNVVVVYIGSMKGWVVKSRRDLCLIMAEYHRRQARMVREDNSALSHFLYDQAHYQLQLARKYGST